MIDPLWRSGNNDIPVVQAETTRPIIIKSISTKQSRLVSLRATFEPLAEIASISSAMTATVINTLEKWFRQLSFEEKG